MRTELLTSTSLIPDRNNYNFPPLTSLGEQFFSFPQSLYLFPALSWSLSSRHVGRMTATTQMCSLSFCGHWWKCHAWHLQFAIPWLIPLGDCLSDRHHHCKLSELFQLVHFCSWRDVLRHLPYISSQDSWPNRCAQWLRTAFSKQSLNLWIWIEQTSAKFKLKMLRTCELSFWITYPVQNCSLLNRFSVLVVGCFFFFPFPLLPRKKNPNFTI